MDRSFEALAEAEQRAGALCAESLRRLDVELESGGNIRFVDGTNPSFPIPLSKPRLDHPSPVNCRRAKQNRQPSLPLLCKR